MFGVLIFTLCVTSILAGKCTLLLDEKKPAIFWRNLGSNHVLLKVANNRVEWDDRYYITGYCPSEFTLGDYYGQHSSESASFSCSGNTIRWQIIGESNERALSNPPISCRRTAQYYEASIPMCNSYGLAYGFFVEGISLVLAGSCYDLKSMQSKFLHYIAGPETSVVEYRAGLNSVNLTTDVLKVDMDYVNIEDEKEILTQAIEKAFPKYKKFLQFILDDLISFRGSKTFTSSYFNDFDCVNLIPWWTSLKYGNWETLEEIVSNLARYGTYDIYTGVSGVVTYVSDDKCPISQELTYEVNHNMKKVPLYVWKYIKGRNNDTDKGVVIVGINSPFVQHLNRSANLCFDICDELKWMEPLQKTRKFVALGYVFCCHPDEVETKLDNFPTFVKQSVSTQPHIFSSSTTPMADTTTASTIISTSIPNYKRRIIDYNDYHDY